MGNRLILMNRMIKRIRKVAIANERAERIRRAELSRDASYKRLGMRVKRVHTPFGVLEGIDRPADTDVYMVDDLREITPELGRSLRADEYGRISVAVKPTELIRPKGGWIDFVLLVLGFSLLCLLGWWVS